MTLEASYFGIGVATRENGKIKSIIDPAPFRPFRFTPASWIFLEEAYSEFLACPSGNRELLLEPFFQNIR